MRNCFEMLGLEFDPPDSVKKIKAAFEDWKKRLTTEQNTTVDVQRLNEIKEDLAMSGYISTVIDNPKIREMEAKKLKEKRIEQLRLYISLIGAEGETLQVTKAQMKKVSEKLRLSLSTVEATYRQKGFEIKNPRNKNSIVKTLNEFFMSDTVMNELRRNFADFQTLTDFKRYPWAPSIDLEDFDLYELAFKLDRSEESSAPYHYWDASELSEIFQSEAQQIAEPIPAWNSIKALLNIAQMQIFNSNENKYRYNHSLQLEPMKKFFADLKSAPEIFKRDPYFADKCIKNIQNHSSLVNVPNNYEIAVSLYNKAVGLLNEPYESPDNPAEIFFYVTCGNCQTSTQFRTREAVQNSKCPVCGESFFIDCPNCHKKIPSASKWCPNCDFPLMEMQEKIRKFPVYIKQAKEILADLEKTKINIKNEDSVKLLMNHVESLILEAGLLKPEHAELKALKDRLAKLRKSQELIALENWAQTKLLSMSVSHEKAVSNCIEVLQKMQSAGIKNYRPALERLSRIPPKAPASIAAIIKEPLTKKAANNSITNKISVNGKSQAAEDYEEVKLHCSITWQPADDLGVNYQLIRKIGGVPQNNKDGELLLDKSDKLEFEDKNILTGVLYGYAVFSVRVGAVSEPVSCQVVHYSDIEERNLTAKTEDGFCHFSWIKPSKRCIGIRILRTDSDGNSVVIDGCCRQSPFVDRAVRSKKQYYYRLQCVYEAVNDNEMQNPNGEINYNEVWKVNHKYEYSDGLTVKLTPESPPVALQNISYHVLQDGVIFNWRSTGEFNVIFREVKNSQFNVDSIKKMGNRIELIRLDNIFGSKKVLATTDSRNQSCEFRLTDEFCKIAVVSATQTLGVICDVVTIANITPCTIDKERTSIDNGKLKIILNPLPDNLVKIHYALNNKNTRGRLYMTIDDAKNNRMRSIFAKKYELDKVIIVHSPPQMELYLTVIGEYKMSDGSTFYSEPSTEVINNRPKAEIVYWLEWASSGVFKKTSRAKNCKLVIETKAEYTPALYLAYNKNGGSNIELDEPSTVKIRMIPSSETGFLGGHQEFPLDNSNWDSIAEGTVIKLLPSKKDAKHFDIRPARPESLKVPPK